MCKHQRVGFGVIVSLLLCCARSSANQHVSKFSFAPPFGGWHSKPARGGLLRWGLCSPVDDRVQLFAKKGKGRGDMPEQEWMEERARIESGEALYAETNRVADFRDKFHEDNYYDDGLEWPSDEYPLMVPAFTATMATGIIGQDLVDSPLLSTLMTEEEKKLREEFNIRMQVRGVAEHGSGSNRMLLSNEPLYLHDIRSQWASKAVDYDAETFSKFMAEAEGDHRMMVECSGQGEEMDADPALWSQICVNIERWQNLSMHVVLADDEDAELGRYVLASVLSDMEHWEEFEQMWADEEEELGEPAEPFQEGRIEGKIHQFFRELSGLDMTKEDLRQQHIEMFGVDPEVARVTKQSRVRAKQSREPASDGKKSRGGRGQGRGRDGGGRRRR